MYTSTVDEQGDSMTLTVPPELRERLNLRKGQQVLLDIEGDHLVVKQSRRSKYTLEELLAQCDFSIPMSDEEREWLDAPAVGTEIV
jgi:antitoxin ChpS